MDAVTATTSTLTTTTDTTAVPETSDYQTYLEMLTVQLQNQDPLDPMEADDFAVQLATFSMVEQQTYTNALLETIIGQQGEQTLAQMSAWVGMEARGSFAVQYSGDPVEVYMPFAIYGSSHDLVVVDAEGEEVRRIPVQAQGEIVAWDGIDDEGLPVEEGLYGFRIDSFEGEELVSSGPVETYALVTEVRMTGEGVRLIAPGDVEIDPNEVSALRTPDEITVAEAGAETTEDEPTV